MKKFQLGGLTVYQDSSALLNTNMYLLMDRNEALVVDPHDCQTCLDLLNEHAVRKVTILLTHEHPDHTCGVPGLVRTFVTETICQQQCARAISEARNNRSLMFLLKLSEHPELMQSSSGQALLRHYQTYTCKADCTFSDSLQIIWHSHELHLVATPGHSPGSCCIILDNTVIFTGDSLLKEVPVITRFPGGDRNIYDSLTKAYLKQLSGSLYVLPGHGASFYLEEYNWNV